MMVMCSEGVSGNQDGSELHNCARIACLWLLSFFLEPRTH
jgi:hypothetical protein